MNNKPSSFNAESTDWRDLILIHNDKWLDKKTTWFIVITQLIMMIYTQVSSYLKAGPESVYYITLGSFVVFVLYAAISKNELFIKLLIFGFFAGILELLTDHYSVAIINKLVYPPADAKILSSPLYMPISWTIALTQLGYYSLLLVRWKGAIVASIVISLIGALYIPFYEQLAKDAGWWYYENCSMVMDTPYYVISFEALLFLLLPVFVVWVNNKKIATSAVLGVALGVWMLIAAVISYLLFP